MIRAVIRSFIDFVKDHGQMLAAAISCFFMLSFIPFFVFLVSILSLIVAGREDFKAFLLDRISDFFPAVTSEISNELVMLINNTQVGYITLAGYLFFSYHLYVALESAVNQVFKSHGQRSTLSSAVNSLFIITLLMAIVLIVFGTSIALSLMLYLGRLINLPRIDFLIGTAGFLIPLFLVFLTATALYMYLPRARVSLKHAMKAALFTAVLLEAAKHLFTFYVAVKLAQFGAFYGSLTGVVIFLMWLLYSVSIFLIGAGIVYNLELEDRSLHSARQAR